MKRSDLCWNKNSRCSWYGNGLLFLGEMVSFCFSLFYSVKKIIEGCFYKVEEQCYLWLKHEQK